MTRLFLPIPASDPDDPPYISTLWNVEWFNYVTGMLGFLADPAVWAGTPDEQKAAVAAVSELMSYMSADCSCIAAIRYKPGVGLIAQVDGVDYFLSGSDRLGLQQDPLSTVLDTATGAPSLPPATPPRDYVCAGVRGLVTDFLIPRYKDVWDSVDLYIDGALSLAEAVVNVVDAMAFDLASQLTPVDDIAALIRTWENFLYETVMDTLNDPDFVEDIEEELYCAIKSASPVTGELTVGVWNAFTAWVGNFWQGTHYHGMQGFLESYHFDQIRKRFNVYALEPDTFCNALGWCPDKWTHTFDFTTGSHGFTATYGSYSAGVGFVHGDYLQDANTRIRRALITRSGIPAFTLTKMTTNYDCVVGDGYKRFQMGNNYLGQVFYDRNNSPPPPAAGTPATYVHTGTYSSVVSLLQDVRICTKTGSPPGACNGSVTIKSIVLEGEGENPFD